MNLRAVELTITLGALAFSGCSKPGIEGTWGFRNGDELVTLRFDNSGHFSKRYVNRDMGINLDFQQEGTYTLGESNTLTMKVSNSVAFTMKYSLSIEELKLSGPLDPKMAGTYRRVGL